MSPAIETRKKRERTAADRLFGLLPQEQEHELRGLWEEFEAQETPDARFANMADRLMPVLQNYHNGGGTWREAAVDRQAVDRRMQPLAAAPAVHDYVKQVLDSAVAQGMIRG